MDSEFESLWKSGACVFGEGDARVFLTLYVDILLVVWKQREFFELVMRQLRERFKMKDLMGMLSG